MPKISVLKGKRLIEQVRANKPLYDPSEEGYADFGVKQKLWNGVAAKCGIKTGQEAKMIWKNLRDCYRISRNKLQYSPKSKMWKFYDDMNFIEPYIKERKIRPPSTCAEDSLCAESSPTIEGEEVNVNEGYTTIQFWNDNDSRITTTDTSTDVRDPEPSVEMHPEADNNVRQVSPVESEPESYVNVLPEELENGAVNNSLRMFFDAMYASTSQLPSALQRTVKNKIFAAILEAEEEAENYYNAAQRSLVSEVKSEI